MPASATEDQHPDHDDPGRDTPVLPGSFMVHARLRFCGLEVGAGLGLEALGHGVSHRGPSGLAGQFEGKGGDAQPGDAERPGAKHVRKVVHAEQQPADADRGDQRDDHDGKGAAPNSAGRRQEDQEQGAVADDRAKRVPAGEAVAVPVSDGMGDHRAQPADQCLEDRVKRQRSGPGDQQVDRQPPPAPDGQRHDGQPDERPQHAPAAQPGDRLDGADNHRVAGDEAVQPGCRAVIGRLERRPPKPHQDKQEAEDERRHRYDDERGENAPGSR